MASLQRYSSHGQTYWRIVESFRRPDGKPTVRVLMHLGKAEELLARLHEQRVDPWVCAFRPQYHWTDQKLMVHALLAVLSLLLGRVLLRRAQRQGFFPT